MGFICALCLPTSEFKKSTKVTRQTLRDPGNGISTVRILIQNLPLLLFLNLASTRESSHVSCMMGTIHKKIWRTITIHFLFAGR
ncbi:hypothetical protein GDO78_003150 [Eleutherodactylus coqui]|uniref:Uncharacterized protein n=1 Tax=Eleutherodactylus coqui TaxID=57060 RepID=A0A8J6EVG5_ELECQ|nr:hypothetical protein GDO78_003150 [Eleutherodactylus coqui]